MHRRIWTLMACLALFVVVAACGSSESDMPAEMTPDSNDMTDALAAGADRAAIVAHLMQAERMKKNTGAMVKLYPDLDRQTAYDIQADILAEKLKMERRIGWKIGYSRMPEGETTVDPIFGHIMETNKFQQNTALSPSLFVNDTTAVEGEFAFWIGKDLPGPDVTREQVIDAISAVGGVVELLSSWTRGPKGMETTHTHDITGNVFHVGVILGEKRVKLKDIDFTQEIVTAEINGAAKATASGTTLMGKDPIEAITWLANELPKYTDTHLKVGDFVISGTVFSPPLMGPGGTAKMHYSTLGTIEVELK